MKIKFKKTEVIIVRMNKFYKSSQKLVLPIFDVVNRSHHYYEIVKRGGYESWGDSCNIYGEEKRCNNENNYRNNNKALSGIK